MLPRAKVFIILRRRDIPRAAVVLVFGCLRIDQPDAHKLLRLRERKPAQHEAVDHRELSGDPADAECEDDHRENAERLLFNKNAKTDSDILAKTFDEHRRLARDADGKCAR